MRCHNFFRLLLIAAKLQRGIEVPQLQTWTQPTAIQHRELLSKLVEQRLQQMKSRRNLVTSQSYFRPGYQDANENTSTRSRRSRGLQDLPSLSTSVSVPVQFPSYDPLPKNYPKQKQVSKVAAVTVIKMANITAKEEMMVYNALRDWGALPDAGEDEVYITFSYLFLFLR